MPGADRGTEMDSARPGIFFLTRHWGINISTRHPYARGPRHLLGTVGLDSQLEMTKILLPNVRFSTWIEPFASCLKDMLWIHRCILFMVYSEMFFLHFRCIDWLGTHVGRPEFFQLSFTAFPGGFHRKPLKVSRCQERIVRESFQHCTGMPFQYLYHLYHLKICITVSFYHFEVEVHNQVVHFENAMKAASPNTVPLNQLLILLMLADGQKDLIILFTMIFSTFLRYFWTSLTWPLPCPFQTPCSATRCLVPHGASEANRLSLLKRLRFNTFGAFHAAIEATERVGMSPTKTSVSHGCLQVYGQEWAFYRTPNPTSCGVCAAGLISHWEDQEVSLVF